MRQKAALALTICILATWQLQQAASQGGLVLPPGTGGASAPFPTRLPVPHSDLKLIASRLEWK